MAWTQRECNTGHTSIINRTHPRLLGNWRHRKQKIAGSKSSFNGDFRSEYTKGWKTQESNFRCNVQCIIYMSDFKRKTKEM